ncbi:MAG TPA: nuclear transport factor 2 family protein [Sphingomicrobium sp.]|nr:nuclear transport factor 2 family protein [Sphingomicrobium sp.]
MASLAVLALLACDRPAQNAAADGNAMMTDLADRKLIEDLERRWGQAFLAKDFDFIEQIVAPEFELVVGTPAGTFIVPRKDWMSNARAWDFVRFDNRIHQVRVTGDTAVVIASGYWMVKEDGKVITDQPYFVVDTWTRRNGSWQAVLRYSSDPPPNTDALDKGQ